MLTYRDVEIEDQRFKAGNQDTLKAMLEEEMSKPWLVIEGGRQWLAYGPWKIIEVTRNNIPSSFAGSKFIFKVMRSRVRRSKIKQNKEGLPTGLVWRKPQPFGWDLTPDGVINLP